MILETLERQAIARGKKTRADVGQSDTVNEVTAFARWHMDGRKADGGYFKFQYVVGIACPSSRQDVIDKLR